MNPLSARKQSNIPAVEFWNRKFSSMSIWCDWIIMRTYVETEIASILNICRIGEDEASQIAWSAFCLAEELNVPLNQAFQDFQCAVPPSERAQFLLYLHVGKMIHQGKSEKEALCEYRSERCFDISVLEERFIKSDFSVYQQTQIIQQTSESLQSTQYWNQHFRELQLWDDFVRLKKAVEREIAIILQTTDFSLRRAVYLGWSAYFDATIGEPSSLQAEYNLLVQNLLDSELPLYLAHTTIGTDIFDGTEEDIARHHYLSWLRENPQHSQFGSYHLQLDLSVRQQKNSVPCNISPPRK